MRIFRKPRSFRFIIPGRPITYTPKIPSNLDADESEEWEDYEEWIQGPGVIKSISTKTSTGFPRKIQTPAKSTKPQQKNSASQKFSKLVTEAVVLTTAFRKKVKEPKDEEWEDEVDYVDEGWDTGIKIQTGSIVTKSTKTNTAALTSTAATIVPGSTPYTTKGPARSPISLPPASQFCSPEFSNPLVYKPIDEDIEPHFGLVPLSPTRPEAADPHLGLSSQEGELHNFHLSILQAVERAERNAKIKDTPNTTATPSSTRNEIDPSKLIELGRSRPKKAPVSRLKYQGGIVEKDYHTTPTKIPAPTYIIEFSGPRGATSDAIRAQKSSGENSYIGVFGSLKTGNPDVSGASKRFEYSQSTPSAQVYTPESEASDEENENLELESISRVTTPPSLALICFPIIQVFEYSPSSISTQGHSPTSIPSHEDQEDKAPESESKSGSTTPSSTEPDTTTTLLPTTTAGTPKRWLLLILIPTGLTLWTTLPLTSHIPFIILPHPTDLEHTFPTEYALLKPLSDLITSHTSIKNLTNLILSFMASLYLRHRSNRSSPTIPKLFYDSLALVLSMLSPPFTALYIVWKTTVKFRYFLALGRSTSTQGEQAITQVVGQVVYIDQDYTCPNLMLSRSLPEYFEVMSEGAHLGDGVQVSSREFMVIELSDVCGRYQLGVGGGLESEGRDVRVGAWSVGMVLLSFLMWGVGNRQQVRRRHR